MKLKKFLDKNFTTVCNAFIKDKNISNAARGLLLTMLSLPEDWDFKIRGLASLSNKDGLRKITTQLNELEAAGYVVRKKIFNKGRVIDWEYIISDEILPEEIRKQSFKAKRQYEDDENTSIEEESELQNVDMENVDIETLDINCPHIRKQDDYKIKNNKIKNNKILINQSYLINQNSEPEKETENEPDEIDEIENYKNILKNQISYENLVDDLKENRILGNLEMLNGLLDIMTEVITSDQKYRISGANHSSNLVKGNIMKLEYEHIVYVLECLYKNTTKIKNIKNYMLTCLYNAPSTIGQYYQNEAASSLYGTKK